MQVEKLFCCIKNAPPGGRSAAKYFWGVDKVHTKSYELKVRQAYPYTVKLLTKADFAYKKR